jgi:sugar lactone lactonase YvrE
MQARPALGLLSLEGRVLMPHTSPVLLHDARATLGEGPVWDGVRGVLWWVDIKRQTLRAFRPDPGELSGAPDGEWSLPGQIGCLGLWGVDRLIVALEQGIYGFDPASATLARHGTLAPEAGATRFNDGKVDPMGRLWVGSLDDKTYPATGALYSIEASGLHQRRLNGISCSNGIGWAPDGGTMYFTDSMRRVIWAFDFNRETGAITRQRDFAHIPAPAVPDGLAVDAEGNVWSALWDGSAIARFAPDGRQIERIAMPVPRPTSCAFGGADMRTLFITSASIDLTPAQLGESPAAGGLFALRTDTPGVPVAAFG